LDFIHNYRPSDPKFLDLDPAWTRPTENFGTQTRSKQNFLDKMMFKSINKDGKIYLEGEINYRLLNFV
jgi:hypothetical protein